MYLNKFFIAVGIHFFVIVIAMAVFEVFDPYLTPPLSSQELAKKHWTNRPGAVQSAERPVN